MSYYPQWPNSVCRVVLVSILSFFVAAQAMAETETETPFRILVTFDNGSAGKSGAGPIPGRSYRYRLRYQIAPAARRDAIALAKEYGLLTVDDWPIESLGVYCVVYEPTGVEDALKLVEQLSRDTRVESAQAMHYFEGMASSAVGYNDAYASFQYGLRSMNVLEAHQFGQGDGVTVAVIDTRIDLNHEDFSGIGIQSHNFAPEDRDSSSVEHGTAVVSLIAANPNNRMGIVGIAPNVHLISVGACWADIGSDSAHCNSFTLAKALDFLVQSPPDLINLSIAGPNDPLLGRLIEKALLNGTLIVAAQPNSSSLSDIYPASYPGVLAVGTADTMPDEIIRREPAADRLFAPGEQIMVALPGNDYDFRSGSSLAAANASGVIALLLEHAPDLDGERVENILRMSQSGNIDGSAVINACRALMEIDIAIACP